MKAKRGDFGYINNRKKRTLTIAIIYSAISIGIYVLGLVLNHMSRQPIKNFGLPALPNISMRECSR